MDQVQNAHKRAIQYWYNDGIHEIGFGALFLLLGGYFFLEGSLTSNQVLRFILESSFVLIIVGGSLLMNKLVQAAKERLTYPRTGYVDYPRRKSPAWARALMSVVIAVVMAGLVAMLTKSQFEVDRWLPIISGVIFGVVFFYFGLRTGVLRFFLLSLIYLLVGGGVFMAGLVGSWGYGTFYALAGLCAVISGACTLTIYLRSHPIDAEQNDES